MKDVVCEETARLCLQAYRDRLRALILTGSLARNEATFVKDDFGCRLLGDAEFLLVFADGARLPTDRDLSVIRRQVEERVLGRGLRADITLAAGRLTYLRELPPSIFAYELRHCGETIAGDPQTLSFIPDFPRVDIPLEDAWRLLANRLVELLEGADELVARRPTLSPTLHYRTVKLYLDMATSFLVFVGGYAPTYDERARTLGTLRHSPPVATRLPFDLGKFVDDVDRCTRWKLNANESVCDSSRTFWEQAIDYAHALWRWELARIVGCQDAGANDTLLMALHMRRQPFRERLRGWAHVTRQSGWRSAWSQWPRWARRALRASPRYAVYAVAAELAFDLRSCRPRLLNIGDDARRRRELGETLPVAPHLSRNGSLPQQSIVADLLFNYHEFLTNTRA